LVTPTERVLDNLIDSTIVHSPAGGHITIEAVAGDGRLQVSVTTERVKIGGRPDLDKHRQLHSV
jgi:signal transduction histidine kinase